MARVHGCELSDGGGPSAVATDAAREKRGTTGAALAAAPGLTLAGSAADATGCDATAMVERDPGVTHSPLLSAHGGAAAAGSGVVSGASSLCSVSVRSPRFAAAHPAAARRHTP